MKNKLRVSDALLLCSIAISILFICFGYNATFGDLPSFMSASLYVPAFIAMISMFVIYLLVERKYNKLKLSRVSLFIFIFLVLENLIVTLCEPSTYTIDAIVRVESSTHSIGDIVRVNINLCNEYKWFTSFAFIGELVLMYSIFLILPKKLPNFIFGKYIMYIYVTFSFITTIVSFITESNLYAQFFNNIFFNHKFETTPCICSIFGQHNLYGVTLLLSFIFSLLLHSYTNKHYFYIPAVYFLINIIFSTSKGSLITAIIMILLYIVVRLIHYYKDYKKTVIILTSIYVFIFIIVIVLFLVAGLSKGRYFSSINNLITSFINSPTIQSRINIWENCKQLLNDRLGWIFGRGYNVFQRMLYPMNSLNNDFVSLEHNLYYCLLGIGGIPMLLAFVYTVVITVIKGIKLYSYKKETILTTFIFTIGFLIYGIIETNYLYVVISFIPIYLLDAEKNVSATIEYEHDLTKEPFSLSKALSFISAIIISISFGCVYPLIKIDAVFIFVPFIIVISLFVTVLLVNSIKNKGNFSFKQFIKNTYINFIIGIIFGLFCILIMTLSKDIDIGKGILIGVMLTIIMCCLYITIPLFKNLSGLNQEIQKLDIKINEQAQRLVHVHK